MSQIIWMMDEAMEYSDFCKYFTLMRIPLGFNRKTAAKVAIPLAQFNRMGVYFGDSKDVAPVLSNLFFAAKREKMRLIIVRSLQIIL